MEKFVCAYTQYVFLLFDAAITIWTLLFSTLFSCIEGGMREWLRPNRALVVIVNNMPNCCDLWQIEEIRWRGSGNITGADMATMCSTTGRSWVIRDGICPRDTTTLRPYRPIRRFRSMPVSTMFTTSVLIEDGYFCYSRGADHGRKYAMSVLSWQLVRFR